MPPGFQEWAESVSLWQVIGWSAGIVGVVLFVWKGWPALRKFAAALAKFIRVVDSVADLPEFMEKTTATLEHQNESIADIHHEVHFNNGSSVKDGVQRVESGVAELSLEVKGLAADLSEAKAALAVDATTVRKDLTDRRAVEDTRNEEEQHD